MATLRQQPTTQDELRELIRSDNLMAFGIRDINGEHRHIVRNENTRREYEIRATAMQFYLLNVGWIKP